LDRGVLEPWKGIEFLQNTTSGAVSLYQYRDEYLVSTFRRQYVGTFLPNDVRERIYYTDESYPKVRSGSAEYRLGLPIPGAPIASAVDAGDMDNITDVINTRYKVTIVDAWGVEGPASEAS